MNIQQAVKLAIEKRPLIARAIWPSRVAIDPTDSGEGCIVSRNGENPCPRWHPQAEDLIAEDWILIDKG